MRPIERFKQSDEIGAAFGPGGRNDKFALRPVERAHHGDFLGLPWRWSAEIGSAPGPSAGQIRMGQSLALIGVEQHDIASFGLGFSQLQP